jgi:hypothetical protein
MPMLSRHEVECVLAFLTPPELGAALRVCRLWKCAMDKARCFGFTTVCLESDITSAVSHLHPSTLAQLTRSAFARHVTTLGHPTENQRLNANTLNLDVCRLTRITTLHCRLRAKDVDSIRFPRTLTSISMIIETHRLTNSILEAMVPLDGLTELTMAWLSGIQSNISFAPLQRIPSLTQLVIKNWMFANPNALDDSQVMQLQALPHLTCMVLENFPQSSRHRLYQAPHSLQWQDIGWIPDLDAGMSTAVSRLSRLTRLATGHCTDLACLPHLKDLQSLTVHFTSEAWPMADLERALESCTRLTHLDLAGSSEPPIELSLIVSRMPHLSSLCLVQFQPITFDFLLHTKQLRTLAFHGIHIPSIPEQLFTCSRLEHLFILSALSWYGHTSKCNALYRRLVTALPHFKTLD